MPTRHYRELRVWQVAMALATDVYRLSEGFPLRERYGLTAQLRRSAVSIPSNISEGQARGSPGEFCRFIGIAFGSLAELETQILIAQQLDLAPANGAAALLEKAASLGRMLRTLQSKVEAQRR